MIEMVINGVSTRKVESVTEELCGKSFSKSTVSSLCGRLDPHVKAFRNRSIYKAKDPEESRRLLKETLSAFESDAPNAMKVLEEGFDDVMAVMSLPKKYRQKFRTSNGPERLNEEIRRRDRVIRIYPNGESVIRLIGALLMEQDERWTTGRKYLDMQDYKEHLEKEREKDPKEIRNKKVA